MLEIPPLTIVDLIVLGILGISGLIAWHRGFMKEVLTVSAWLVAALAAVFLWPATKPFARSLVDSKTAADILALVGVFFMLLIPTSFVSFRLSEIVRESRAGPLDRSFGFVFGLARGLLVAGLGYLLYASLAPAKTHPDWVREARLLPIVKGTADVIASLGGKKRDGKEKKEGKKDKGASKDEAKSVPESKHAENDKEPAKKTKPEKDAGTDNKEGGGENGKSYDAGDRRALDQLVRSTSKP